MNLAVTPGAPIDGDSRACVLGFYSEATHTQTPIFARGIPKVDGDLVVGRVLAVRDHDVVLSITHVGALECVAGFLGSLRRENISETQTDSLDLVAHFPIGRAITAAVVSLPTGPFVELSSTV